MNWKPTKFTWLLIVLFVIYAAGKIYLMIYPPRVPKGAALRPNVQVDQSKTAPQK